jgi:alpha-N-arabinofuranosidase
VRFSGRGPKSAAEEVEYFNGGIDTPMGALRKRNGHAEPYRINYWQVGNERQSREYDTELASFCQAMKAVDPTISILSSFPTPGSVRNASGLIDYVSPHHYTPDLAACESSLNSIHQILRENAGDRRIKVAVTEWNTTAGDWGLGRATLMTLANGLACSRYQNLLHRYCDLVEIANRSNLINSFGSGFIQVDNHRLYKTPAYYAQLLYSTLGGSQPLKIESNLPTNAGLDLSATLDPKLNRLVLFAVNDSSREISRRIDFRAFAHTGRQVSVWTLSDSKSAGEPDVRNSFEEPERISIRNSFLSSKTSIFDHSFPPLSLTVLTY